MIFHAFSILIVLSAQQTNKDQRDYITSFLTQQEKYHGQLRKQGGMGKSPPQNHELELNFVRTQNFPGWSEKQWHIQTSLHFLQLSFHTRYVKQNLSPADFPPLFPETLFPLPPYPSSHKAEHCSSSPFSACLPSQQKICLFPSSTLLSPSTFSLPALLNISDKCPITTWLPLTAKLFPLPVKQDDSFKLTISLLIPVPYLYCYIPPQDLSFSLHKTLPTLNKFPSSPLKKHGYLVTISSRNHFFTNKLAFTLPQCYSAINKQRSKSRSSQPHAVNETASRFGALGCTGRSFTAQQVIAHQVTNLLIASLQEVVASVDHTVEIHIPHRIVSITNLITVATRTTSSIAQMKAKRVGCCKPPSLPSQLKVCNEFGLQKWKNVKVRDGCYKSHKRATVLQGK